MKPIFLAVPVALLLAVGASTAGHAQAGPFTATSGCYGSYCPPPPPPPPNNIPEPGTLVMLGMGLIGLGMVRMRRGS